MIPFLTNPLALLALLSVPALLFIYWLRQRTQREVQVSSLMLWAFQRRSTEGGVRIQRLQTPLLFFFELLILLLLCIAAAGPKLQLAQYKKPLVVVLDDSFSMRADAPDSPHQRAIRAVLKEIRTDKHSFVRFVTAGRSPQLLGGAVKNEKEVAALLRRWRPAASSAAVSDALSFAFRLGGKHAHVLLVTDHPPAKPPRTGRLRWWSFGRARPNVAFVNAVRSQQSTTDRVLFEIANLSAKPTTTTLAIRMKSRTGPAKALRLSLKPNEIRRLTFSPPAGSKALYAQLGKDALAFDNDVILLPHPPVPVRTRLAISQEPLRKLLEKTLQATQSSVASSLPEIVITDQSPSSSSPSNAWILQLIADKDPAAYTGPFVLHLAHPLAQGLSLDGVVWAAGKSNQMPGMPVIMAGNTPLLSVSPLQEQTYLLQLRIRPDLSTITKTPNWPILFWNILHWRRAHKPGLQKRNVRLGTYAAFRAPASLRQLQLTTPNQQKRALIAAEHLVNIEAKQPGLYHIQADAIRTSFAVNALHKDESNLLRCASGRWGQWQRNLSSQREYRDITWIFLLLALLLLTVHLWMMARTPNRGE